MTCVLPRVLALRTASARYVDVPAALRRSSGRFCGARKPPLCRSQRSDPGEAVSDAQHAHEGIEDEHGPEQHGLLRAVHRALSAATSDGQLPRNSPCRAMPSMPTPISSTRAPLIRKMVCADSGFMGSPGEAGSGRDHRIITAIVADSRLAIRRAVVSLPIAGQRRCRRRPVLPRMQSRSSRGVPLEKTPRPCRWWPPSQAPGRSPAGS